jgi:hypothetical protein
MSLSIEDIQHLDAAEAWLECEDYCTCFKELERISNRDHPHVLTLLWELYIDAGLRSAAADVAKDIDRRDPGEAAQRMRR